ncbi:hypothetical protein [Mycobacterium leprae]|nr:hypothetical protein [Mycobacterium leprae]
MTPFTRILSGNPGQRNAWPVSVTPNSAAVVPIVNGSGSQY